jgi:AcrR family transcriptional regulator
MSSRKQELLDALIAYLSRHGPADLSLRPMAAEIGTSARLLIFHFGSKERLLAEVLDEMQRRLQDSFQRMRSAPPGTRTVPLLRAFWDWALQEDNFPSLCLLYQLNVLAARDPALRAKVLTRHAQDWLALIQTALPDADEGPARATLLGAVFDGLFLELMATGDRARTTQALDAFLAMAAPSAPAGWRRS